MLKQMMQIGAPGSKGLTIYITVFSNTKLSQLLGIIEMEVSEGSQSRYTIE
jgi:hypothetical protein